MIHECDFDVNRTHFEIFFYSKHIQENTAQEMNQLIELYNVATGSYWLRIGSETPMKLVKN
jgi:hypothetical protein